MMDEERGHSEDDLETIFQKQKKEHISTVSLTSRINPMKQNKPNIPVERGKGLGPLSTRVSLRSKSTSSETQELRR
ncbi:hypothetical protein RRG08_045502 [Elysia crispata]|uniref:Uncharacterized protein n=1 Tax=Elysia crispata TaxID=231223 RepID=A0AAE1AFI5_9GAST|nr:hypothetical protein RRG08_045502 [Elysia crispata]